MKANLLVILGPTASGKTRLAINVTQRLNGEIISADSRQVYRGMNIGTGKDIEEYTANGQKVPYHLIDIVAAGDKYNVNAFKEDFYKAFEDISARNSFPVLCGGSGMYIHSLFQDQPFTAIPVNMALRDALGLLDKDSLLKKLAAYPNKLTAHADLSSVKRITRAIEVAEFLSWNKLEVLQHPVLAPCIIGLFMDRAVLKQKIWQRLHDRFDSGLISEVEDLRKNGLSEEMLLYYGLEYKYVAMYFRQEFSLTEMKERLFTAICQFAKRQATFFRKMEKDGVKINWLDATASQEFLTESIISLKENTVIKV